MTDEEGRQEQAAQARRLHEAAVRLLRYTRRADGRAGLGPAQMSVLSLLAEKSPRSVQELAQAEGVAHPTMSRLVSALERSALVEKVPDTADRRRHLVGLSSQGCAYHKQAHSRRQQITEALTAMLLPATVDDLTRVLRNLADRLDAGGGQGDVG